MKKNQIVAVDDQETQRRLLAVLAPVECELTLLKDGKEALEHLKENTPDLIILDINMPHMNGLDVCGRIKSIKRLKHIPVIILTADQDKKSRELAEACGADDFIKKPLSGREFSKKIERFLKPAP